MRARVCLYEIFIDLVSTSCVASTGTGKSFVITLTPTGWRPGSKV